MRRFLGCGLGLALWVALPAGAASETRLSETWQGWAFGRAVEIEGSGAQLVRAPLELEILTAAQPRLVDLRVLDGAGLEVPYLIEVGQGSTSRSWREVRMSDRGFVPGRYTEAIIDMGDMGDEGLLHNSAELLTGADDFFVWVAIATSEDRRTWKIVREKAPAYRFRQDDLDGNRELSYPESRSRWLRLQILDGAGEFPLDDVKVAYEVKEPVERLAIAPRLRRLENPPEGRSAWIVDLGDEAAISGVRFRADGEEFHRPVIVRAGPDGETWTRAGQGDIYRQQTTGEAGGERVLEELEIELTDRWARYWNVEVVDRDDRPVDGLVPELLTTRRDLIFAPENRKEYVVIYGNPQAQAASYDLARVTTRAEIDRAVPVRLGERMRNTAYVSGEPWTEQHPVLLWLALGGAVAILGMLALRAIK